MTSYLSLLRRIVLITGLTAGLPLWGDILFITTGNLPEGKVGDLYQVDLQAEGGHPPYSWSVWEEIAAWGGNANGQSAVPLGLTGVAQVCAGSFHSLALKTDGTVVVWGGDSYGQCEVPSGLAGVVLVAAGDFHNLALKSDGTVVAWGRNDYGQCDVPAGLTDVVAISGGWGHSLALKSDGTVVAWGWNKNFQCAVPGGLNGVTAISAGGKHSLALTANGTVVAWGAVETDSWIVDYGQCDVPSDLSGVVAVSAGDKHSLALKSDGTVMAWGDNFYRQTVVPSDLSGVTMISAGARHNLALKTDGTVVAWGENTSNNSVVPEGLWSVVGISAGVYNSIGWKSDSSTFPAGLDLSEDGVLEGYPERPGSFSLPLMVKDPTGRVTIQTFPLVIGVAPVTHDVLGALQTYGNNVYGHPVLGALSFADNGNNQNRVLIAGMQTWLDVRETGNLWSEEYGTVTLGGDAQWVHSSFFGWTHFGADAVQYDGWVHTERFGWMKFVFSGGDTGLSPYLYAPRINSWMAVNGDGSFTSFQWGQLTPDPTDMSRYTSSIFGGLTTGEFGGWVASDRFGWMWANGDGTWFWSETRKEWLGVTAEGGIWSTNEGRFL